MTVILADLLLL